MLLDVPLICQDFGCIYSQDSVCKLNVSNLLNIKVVFDGWVGGKERKTSKNDELPLTECEIKVLFVINVSVLWLPQDLLAHSAD